MTDDLEPRLSEALKTRARVDPDEVRRVLDAIDLPSRSASRRRLERLAAAVVVIGLALGGVAIGLASQAGHSGPRTGVTASVTDTADDGTFRLTMTADRGSYVAGEAIGITASLTYLGPDATIDAMGTGSGIVTLGVQRDGDRMIGGSGGRLSCVSRPMVKDKTIDLVPAKIAGFAADDPDADFIRAYATDPLLHLPSGTWHLHAFLNASVGDCGAPAHQLDASVTVVVTGDAATPARPSPPASPSPTPVRSDPGPS
jgi:hypothetical protein